MMDPNSIDWSNPSAKISNHFTVKEATYLPSWGVCHQPSDEEKANICKQAEKMDMIRDFLGLPIKVHVWIRPGAANCPGNEHDGEDYNALVHGAPASAHKIGAATDWDCGENCDDTRAKLLPKLEEFGIRMERRDGSNWVHNDYAAPHPNRYFLA
jgi:hypothetical protein